MDESQQNLGGDHRSVGVFCPICKLHLEGDRSAVCESADGSIVHFQDPLEDLRAQFDRVTHPWCWADEHSVEQLVDAIERRDAINRQGLWTTQDRIQKLEDKLTEHRLALPE